jgi:LAO/AO transport system kinase
MTSSADAAPVSLAARVAARERPAVARALNLLEDRRPAGREQAARLLAALPQDRLREGGHLVGLTGPPGAGKSTLAAALTRAWRDDGRTVAVLAVDPSSPLSGGALLGDRLRMLQPVPDDGVFIRSLASHGETGGLAAEVGPLSRLLLAAFDVVLVETVGVGQTEVDVAESADTTCLVVQPASGDTIQFLKSGIMEVPTILAVNKADLGEPAERAAAQLRRGLRRAERDAAWEIPVVLVSATRRTGIATLVAALDRHRAWLGDGDRLAATRRGQEAAWGLKRLRDEFGRFGVDRLGGREAVRAAWLETDTPAAKVLEEQRRKLMRELSTLDSRLSTGTDTSPRNGGPR